ncbi:pyridoxamine 5'-phosphate oxidase family protein [Halalkalibacter urbisdiaboli]|uniref:pyridoxamine 5'-phosphate oxidase family protein n=1 Tax=Halalkalibacter urbisdiaboli TaxID=1960589 RepID=UPI0013FDFE44|nr:pyridoxamine 5'-phosphate oxidase family protein [Halalkalibacter urbisdiaboli]
MQSILGVSKSANLVGRVIQPFIKESFQFFMESQPMAVIGSTDTEGYLWSSLVCGDRGFIRVIDDRTIRIHIKEQENDLLFSNLKSNLNVGIIVIEFSTRIRIRINGVANILDDETIEVKTEQVYGNCPKYIQSRQIKLNNVDDLTTLTLYGRNLNNNQRTWIEWADTFFISSSNSLGKTDVSHRGGQAGFVNVLNEMTLLFPDYVGNMMFNTLGNIFDNSKTGLLFIDFQEGHTLQLTGDSKIIWDLTEEEKVKYPGAKRLIEYVISGVIENQNVQKYSWDFLNYSPFNPK